ncbi:MFS transporter [bacterium]|nr:MFS transporter [bacterium]
MHDDKESSIIDPKAQQKDISKHNPLYSLKNKYFRRLWFGMFFSINAMQMTGGAGADRVRKRNLLLITQSNLCLLAIILALLVYSDVVTLWHLVLASILSGLIPAFNMPTRPAKQRK